jgi:hypothetical protein
MRRPRHNLRTASRVFSGEAVVVTPAENMLRMFNTVGSRIWELADGHRTVDDIVDALVLEYDVSPETARLSVNRFLGELASEGLISLD